MSEHIEKQTFRPVFVFYGSCCQLGPEREKAVTSFIIQISPNFAEPIMYPVVIDHCKPFHSIHY